MGARTTETEEGNKRTIRLTSESGVICMINGTLFMPEVPLDCEFQSIERPFGVSRFGAQMSVLFGISPPLVLQSNMHAEPAKAATEEMNRICRNEVSFPSRN